MKLQFGVLYRDERTTDVQDLALLLGDYQAWKAETSGHSFDGPLLMGYRGDRITREEDKETQPFSLGPFMLTFDGRLDNREDIAEKAGLTASRDFPDPALVAHAYAKHGNCIFPSLLGEFALVLWQRNKRELMLVRSVDGARPLYYLADCKWLWWCSDIAHLVTSSGIDLKLNDTYIFEYLLGHPSSDITPFAAIQAVEAGTVLCFDNGSFLAKQRLWQPHQIQPLELKSDAEYEERFRYLITQAIRVRLRAKNTVFAELSGGLDSSSVVLTSHSILRADNKDCLRLQTLSLIYEGSRTTDEQCFIKSVEEAIGVHGIYISEHEQMFTVNVDDGTHFIGLPSIFHLTPGRYPRYIQHMQHGGARVLVTGLGGDQLFCSTPYPEVLVADSLANLDLLSAHRNCKLWSRFAATPYFALLLGKALPLALGPLLPLSWHYTLLPDVPAWVNFNGQRDILLRQSTIKPEKNIRPSQRLRLAAVESLFRGISMAFWSDYRHLYVTHPYSDRRLVEFCMAVPMSQMQRDGETRSLLRRSLAHLLPMKVRTRKGKGAINEPFLRAVQRDWEHLREVEKWQVCTRGYVRPRELNESLRGMRMGLPSGLRSTSALAAIALERFLRSLSVLTRRQAQSSPEAAQRICEDSVAGHSPPSS